MATFTIDAPPFRRIVEDVDGENETQRAHAREVTTALDDLQGACRDQGLRGAVSTLRDDVVGRVLEALSASSESTVEAARATATEYEDFDAGAASKASAAELEE
ncbi:hypothetical protein [Micrococcus lylae]|uniref:ESX-1 secretion-associated protein n=1 Tax=Micrococcus lylae TaxID=1273 RepID=A0ABY2JYP0_9MICC|nr:hypothetical protein [Micrococcus lylae]TFH97907.1 hypothetical protein E4A49_11330 [Micrococcus lylae]